MKLAGFLLMLLMLISCAPEAVKITVPGKNQVIKSFYPRFSWETADGVRSYALQVSRDKEFTDIIIDAADLATWEYTVDTMLTEGDYFFRIKATGKLPGGKWPPALPFSIGPPEFTFTNLNNNDVRFVLKPFELTWEEQEHALSYEVRIDADPAFTDPVVNIKDINKASCLIGGITDDELYYAQVRAVYEGDAYSRWSKPVRFKGNHGYNWSVHGHYFDRTTIVKRFDLEGEERRQAKVEGNCIHTIITGDGGILATGLVEMDYPHITKLTSQGNKAWRKVFKDFSYAYVRPLIETADGHYMWTGAIDTSKGMECLLIKVDNRGNTVFEQHYKDIVEKNEFVPVIDDPEITRVDEKNNDIPYALLENSRGEFIFAGITEFGGTKWKGNSGRGFTSVRSAWVMKLDAEGNEVWKYSYLDEKSYIAYQVIEREDGTYVVFGKCMEDPGYYGNNEIWIVSLDEDGNELSRGVYFTADCGYDIIDVIQWPDGYLLISETCITKIDAYYNRMWQKSIDIDEVKSDDANEMGELYHMIRTITPTDDGHFIIVGGSYYGDFIKMSWMFKVTADFTNIVWSKASDDKFYNFIIQDYRPYDENEGYPDEEYEGGGYDGGI